MKILIIVSTVILITGFLMASGKHYGTDMEISKPNDQRVFRAQVKHSVIQPVVERVLDTSNPELPITDKFHVHNGEKTFYKIGRLKNNGEPYTDYDFQREAVEYEREYQRAQSIGRLINYGQVDTEIYRSHSALSYNAANVEAHLSLWYPVTNEDDIFNLAKTEEYRYRIRLAKESQELFAALALYEAGVGKLLSPDEANSFIESVEIDNYLEDVRSYLEPIDLES